MYYGNCLAISPGKYQEIGCSLSFDSLAKYAMGLKALVTFNISVNQTATQSFADPPISRNPASRPAHSPFTPRDAQCPWEGHRLITAISKDRQLLMN